MNDLAVVENTVASITTTDGWLDIKVKLQFIKDAIKRIDKLMEAKGVALIEQFGSILFGDKEYVLGVDTTWKPQEKPICFAEDLMAQLGGDWDAFSRCLASGAFKPGQTRIELKAIHGDKSEAIFATFYRQSGDKFVDVKKVKEIDTRFTKGKRCQTSEPSTP